MKKIFKTVLAISAGLAATSCASWLETSSPSVVDADFVFSDFSTGKDVMLGAYDTYVGLVNEGLTINLESIGSDIERASVGLVAAQIGAAQLYGPESLGYTTEKFDINDKNITKWATYYSVIARCNNIIANSVQQLRSSEFCDEMLLHLFFPHHYLTILLHLVQYLNLQ